MGGDSDRLADMKDVDWLVSQLKENVFFYHQYHLGHMSFAWAKDMSYFTVDAMSILNMRNDKVEEVCEAKFDSSNYEERH